MSFNRLFLITLLCIGGVGQSLFATDARPKTLRAEPQQRDDYNWAERHEAVLARHRLVSPEIVFIGDSITHHWGGEPLGKRRVAPEIWDALFAPSTVSNLGFGYDYADNAYYRVEQGELDHIAPRLILINIGTNNLGHRHQQLGSSRRFACGLCGACGRFGTVNPKPTAASATLSVGYLSET